MLPLNGIWKQVNKRWQFVCPPLAYPQSTPTSLTAEGTSIIQLELQLPLAATRLPLLLLQLSHSPHGLRLRSFYALIVAHPQTTPHRQEREGAGPPC